MVPYRLLAALILLYVGSATYLYADNSISVSPRFSQEGFLTVDWSAAREETVRSRLLIARDDRFHDVVTEVPVGSQQKVHVSGLRDGTYYAQLVDTLGAGITKTVSFEVQHRSLQAALPLFFAGAGLFLLLLVVLFRFSRQSA